MERHAIRRATRRRGITGTFQYLPAQARRLRREHAHPRIYQRETRARNKEYEKARQACARAWRRGDRQKARELRRKQASLPSVDCADPGYRRLRYLRYADDALFGFTGPKAEAEEIKQRLTTFMRDELRLELSDQKTLITHARTGAAKFLGYEITTQHSGTSGRRTINGSIALRVPIPVIKAKCSPWMARGKPAAQTALHNRSDYDIVAAYGAHYRGIVQYYLLAGDVHRMDRLRWVMETSLLKTLAAKHGSSVAKMAAHYKAVIETPARAAHLLRGRPHPRREPETPGRTVRRYPPQTAENRGPHRPRSRPGHSSPQGDHYPAPAEQVRVVPARRPGAGAPCRQAGRPRAPRSRPASLGQAHGKKAAQVPGGLPALPRPDPC